jgi:Xaa-Pro aminopeptidase
MITKTAWEMEQIQKACEIAEDAFLKLLPEIKEGMSETEVAALLEYNMRALGAEGTSFATIVAFGAHAAVPHHQTGETRLQFGDEILIDFGCKVNGYCSDITRTFLFGDDGKHEEFKKAYQAVLTAHNLVKEKLQSGMLGKEADALARDYLKAQGYGELFTHSLGHGIGLNVHEAPGVNIRSEKVLVDGMVFSDEPGVYVVGEYGIRIEDTVRLENGKVKSFMSKTDRNLIIL